jgi:hypothetical protein
MTHKEGPHVPAYQNFAGLNDLLWGPARPGKWLAIKRASLSICSGVMLWPSSLANADPAFSAI